MGTPQETVAGSGSAPTVNHEIEDLAKSSLMSGGMGLVAEGNTQEEINHITKESLKDPVVIKQSKEITVSHRRARAGMDRWAYKCGLLSRYPACIVQYNIQSDHFWRAQVRV